MDQNHAQGLTNPLKNFCDSAREVHLFTLLRVGDSLKLLRNALLQARCDAGIVRKILKSSFSPAWHKIV